MGRQCSVTRSTAVAAMQSSAAPQLPQSADHIATHKLNSVTYNFLQGMQFAALLETETLMHTAITTIPQTFIALMEARQAALELSDHDLCAAVGLEREIALGLIKAGSMRMPLTKIPTLAAALELDPAELLKLALSEQSPDLLQVIEEAYNPLRLPLSEGMILQLHGILYRYMPQPGGHWKATNNDIIERHPDGSSRIRFRPVAAHLTPMAMADLIARYRTALDQHLADPLVLVPLVILDFLCIHPFPDGNGRMARLLTLQLLYHFDYAVCRFISLERIFEESKESYYETLEASSQGWHDGTHNIAPWLDYFWGALLRAYKEFEERVGTIERGRGAKGDRVRAEILKRQLPFSISEIEGACPGISRDMVRVILRAMKAEGLITPNGKGRGAKWESIQASAGQAPRTNRNH